ncbi:hypothetical protein OTU49_009267 [Cherax quadricarinatus]|uniref:Cyclin B n=1 Tax=Cherax quadricarinatus TaxID=27406 RepID=A0AAW0WMM9_CHEQU
MSVRSNMQPSVIGFDNGPRKVEAKVLQGPILHRPALGEVGNRSVSLRGLKAPVKPVDVARKRPVLTRPTKPKSNSISLCRVSGKENVGLQECEKVEEEMDVEEVAKVEELSVAFSTQCLNVEDIDAEDGGNPQLVSEYVNDIYKYLRELEEGSKVQPRYLDGQVVTGKMRAILIDWLVQVHLRFMLLQETLYLTVAIIDRYLQRERTVSRSKLQLVGVTAMFIASKYEEMYSPDIADFAYITDKAYTKNEIRKMEVNILKTLDFNVSYPLPLHFLRRNSKAGSVDAAQHTLAKYLMELCLPEYCMCHYKASMIAAAALCFSLKVLDGSPWNDTLVYYSCNTEEQLMPVICKMAAIVVKSISSKQQAVKQKYKTNKQMKISDIPQLHSQTVKKLAEKGALT